MINQLNIQLKRKLLETEWSAQRSQCLLFYCVKFNVSKKLKESFTLNQQKIRHNLIFIVSSHYCFLKDVKLWTYIFVDEIFILCNLLLLKICCELLFYMILRFPSLTSQFWIFSIITYVFRSTLHVWS